MCNEPQGNIDLSQINKELRKAMASSYEDVMEILIKLIKENQFECDFSDGVFGALCIGDKGTITLPTMYLYALMFKIQEDDCSHEWLFKLLASFSYSLFFATAPLSDILENIGNKLEYLNDVLVDNCANYLLINPREDVVRWALEHRDIITFRFNFEKKSECCNETDKTSPEVEEMISDSFFVAFIKTHQINPELRKLVLDTFKDNKKSE